MIFIIANNIIKSVLYCKYCKRENDHIKPFIKALKLYGHFQLEFYFAYI